MTSSIVNIQEANFVDPEPDKVKHLLENAGFFPIAISGTVDSDDSKGYSFDGNFNQYLNAIKALNGKVIFVTILKLTDQHFFINNVTESDIDDEMDMSSGEEEVDLRLIDSRFDEFTKRIGTIATIKLSSTLTDESLNYYIQPDWWVEFMRLCIEIDAKVQDQQLQINEKRLVAARQKEQALIKQIRELIHDSKFCRLPTQRAMNTYAHDKIADLSLLKPNVIKMEIQALSDKLRE